MSFGAKQYPNVVFETDYSRLKQEYDICLQDFISTIVDYHRSAVHALDRKIPDQDWGLLEIHKDILLVYEACSVGDEIVTAQICFPFPLALKNISNEIFNNLKIDGYILRWSLRGEPVRHMQRMALTNILETTVEKVSHDVFRSA